MHIRHSRCNIHHTCFFLSLKNERVVQKRWIYSTLSLVAILQASWLKIVCIDEKLLWLENAFAALRSFTYVQRRQLYCVCNRVYHIHTYVRRATRTHNTHIWMFRRNQVVAWQINGENVAVQARRFETFIYSSYSLNVALIRKHTHVRKSFGYPLNRLTHTRVLQAWAATATIVFIKQDTQTQTHTCVSRLSMDMYAWE